MGGSGSKRISLNSIDNLPPDIFQTYLEKSKHAINDQYDSNTSIIYFPQYAGCTIYSDGGEMYKITGSTQKLFDKELTAYCKELIRRPYITVGRTVYLVENYE
jgi:hypothetical protein